MCGCGTLGLGLVVALEVLWECLDLMMLEGFPASTILRFCNCCRRWSATCRMPCRCAAMSSWTHSWCQVGEPLKWPFPMH